MLNFSDVVVLPLVNGIPDLANRLVVDSGAVEFGPRYRVRRGEQYPFRHER